MRKLGLGILIAAVAASPLAAQDVRVGARASLDDSAHITFGYLCDDRFIVQNDGANALRLEYGLENAGSVTALGLGGRESVELLTDSRRPLQLSMGGRVIATANNERRSCRDVQGT